MKKYLLICLLVLVTIGTQAQQKIKDGTGYGTVFVADGSGAAIELVAFGRHTG